MIDMVTDPHLLPFSRPSAPAATDGGADGMADSVPDFDDLARRLQALKRQ